MKLDEIQIGRIYKAMLLVPGRPFLRTDEVAQILGVSKPVALGCMRTGGLDGLWFFRESERLGGGHGTRSSEIEIGRETILGLLRLHMLCSDEGTPPNPSTVAKVRQHACCLERETAALRVNPKEIGRENTIAGCRISIEDAVRRSVVNALASENAVQR